MKTFDIDHSEADKSAQTSTNDKEGKIDEALFTKLNQELLVVLCGSPIDEERQKLSQKSITDSNMKISTKEMPELTNERITIKLNFSLDDNVSKDLYVQRIKVKVHAQWFYCIRDLNIPYNKQVNEKIEEAFRKKLKSFLLSVYELVDFGKFKLINLLNGVEFNLMRRPCDDELLKEIIIDDKTIHKKEKTPMLSQLPPACKGCTKIPLTESFPEYSVVKALFDKTMIGHYRNLKIIKLKNNRVKFLYNTTLIQVCKENKQRPNEATMKLFYGPEDISPELICNGYNEAFDPKYEQLSVWGKGVQFVPTVPLIKGFAYVEEGIHQVLLASVITGNVCDYGTTIDPELLYPPFIPTNPNKRYDSVKGHSNGMDVYVVYDKSMAYPEYLIEYEDN